MTTRLDPRVEQAREAALEVLRHNAHGPFHGLPRTAGWGYPEAYTRDIMISALGMLVSGDKMLPERVHRVLTVLARNQSPLGHIPSLAHDPEDRGASDTTPLFLIGLGAYRLATGERDFLKPAATKALRWMAYQSPEDRVIVAQEPTSDWRDEQWVSGFGLFVNTLVYTHLRMFGKHKRADLLRELMNRFAVEAEGRHRHVHEGLVLAHKPYYALWSYKLYSSERFDLLGNSLAILSGIASRTRSRSIVAWVEHECEALREKGQLAVSLPPNLFPYIRRDHPDWRPRYETYNKPGEYHNGGVWPFICGFYVAAIVAAGRIRLARQRLRDLAELVRPARDHDVSFGFNEWIRAQDGLPCGQDWQTWSAAMFVYACACVERKCTPFFDEVRVAGP
jgi:hypothetical protein